MRVEEGKIIIAKKDLGRKIVVIRNHKSEEELQASQFSAMEAVPGCMAIPESSFEKYNRFRVSNGHKRKDINKVMIIDLQEFEAESDFDKFSEKNKAKK